MVPPEATPTFLRPLMDPYILLAGKSMHLIESIGKLKHIQEGVVHSPSKGTATSFVGVSGSTPNPDLYQDFLRALSERHSPHGLVRPHGLGVESCDLSCDLDQDEERGWRVTPLPHYDSLMNSYLELLKKSAHKGPPNNSGVLEIALPESSLVPLNCLIQDKLHPLLQHHYKIVCVTTPTWWLCYLSFEPTGVWSTGGFVEVRVQPDGAYTSGTAIFSDGGGASHASVHERSVLPGEPN